jgi:SAM-dependent methyltransferase
VPRFALLIAPSTNRVYADSALPLTRAELSVFGAVSDIAETRIGGLPYVTFEAPGDPGHLANLSSMYGLFECVGELLRPVELHPVAYFDEDLVTIPKYAGKTNEQFTRLLLNVTLLAAGHVPGSSRLTVLDPLCGRGTTLNIALRYGYHAIGIERDGKHHAELNPVRRDRKLVARRFSATVAERQTVTVYHADTVDARQFLKAGSADVVVADAPYGVAHGSHAGGARTRGPLDLLRAAAPVWVELLAPGGALGISWNTHVANRDEAVAVLEKAGLAVVDLPDLAHRVDQAIQRDVIVARRA